MVAPNEFVLVSFIQHRLAKLVVRSVDHSPRPVIRFPCQCRASSLHLPLPNIVQDDGYHSLKYSNFLCPFFPNFSPFLSDLEVAPGRASTICAWIRSLFEYNLASYAKANPHVPTLPSLALSSLSSPAPTRLRYRSDFLSPLSPPPPLTAAFS